METPKSFTKQTFNLQLEVIVWCAFSSLFGFRVITALALREPYMIFKEYYFDFLVSIIVLLFPFLFRLIYSEFPFQYLRHKRITNNKSRSSITTNVVINDPTNETSINVEENIITVTNASELDILKIYLKQSQKLSEQIYSRSSVYLLIGCLIAFVGVAFFYFQSISVHTDSRMESGIVFTFSNSLPRVGILIFVEAIAFFFLRQYKSTMEEFRYYEAIKRQRENQYLVASCGHFHNNNPDYFVKLVNNLNLNENPNKLAKDETTQLIEHQKISGPESDVIDKFIDLLKIVKK